MSVNSIVNDHIQADVQLTTDTTNITQTDTSNINTKTSTKPIHLEPTKTDFKDLSFIPTDASHITASDANNDQYIALYLCVFCPLY